MLKSHDHSRALRTKNHTGGSGEKTALLDEKEETRDKETVLCVIYLDHILFKNVNSDKLRPALRIAIGWLIKDTPEYIVVIWDKPLIGNRNEIIFPCSCQAPVEQATAHGHQPTAVAAKKP